MRESKIIELEENGHTLRFEIMQMPAAKLESWIYRAVLSLGPVLNLPDDADMSAIGTAIAKNGFKGLMNIDYSKAKPLIDEMLETVTRIVDNTVRQPVTIDTVDGYIENVKTLMRLRLECFKVNLGFFLGEGTSDSQSGIMTPKASHQSPIRISRA